MSKYDTIKLNVDGKQDYAIKVQRYFSANETARATKKSFKDEYKIRDRSKDLNKLHTYLENKEYDRLIDSLIDCLEFDGKVCRMGTEHIGDLGKLAAITCFSMALALNTNSSLGSLVTSYGVFGTIIYVGDFFKNLVKSSMIKKQIYKLNEVKDRLVNNEQIEFENVESNNIKGK